MADGRSSSIAENGQYWFEESPVEVAQEGVDCVAAYWELAKGAGPSAGIELVSAGAPTGILSMLLRQQNVPVEETAALRVVVTDDYLRPEVAKAIQPKIGSWVEG